MFYSFQPKTLWNLVKSSEPGMGMWPKQGLSESYTGIDVPILDKVL